MKRWLICNTKKRGKAEGKAQRKHQGQTKHAKLLRGRDFGDFWITRAPVEVGDPGNRAWLPKGNIEVNDNLFFLMLLLEAGVVPCLIRPCPCLSLGMFFGVSWSSK